MKQPIADYPPDDRSHICTWPPCGQRILDGEDDVEAEDGSRMHSACYYQSVDEDYLADKLREVADEIAESAAEYRQTHQSQGSQRIERQARLLLKKMDAVVKAAKA